MKVTNTEQRVKPVLIGISGTRLTSLEKALLEEHKPLGVIIYRRNTEFYEMFEEKTGDRMGIVQDKKALIDLITEIKEILGENAIIAIDQEGPPVVRLYPPTFKYHESASYFGNLAKEKGIEIASQACYENYKNIGEELSELGIKVDFCPVADSRRDGPNDKIGKRSFSTDPDIVIELCKAAKKGLNDAGVTESIKHAPDYGLVSTDTHFGLARISASKEELETGFKVFKDLSGSKMVMTTHTIYDILDPDCPITLSAKGINYIRDTLGFKDAWILSDALEMGALKEYCQEVLKQQYNLGDIAKEFFKAGGDIALICNGKYEDTLEVLGAVESVDIKYFEDLFV